MSGDMISNTIHDAVKAMTARMEKELHGAWRAGYDYVHVYGEDPGMALASQDLSRSVSMSMYVFPTNQKQPPRPETRRYRYTYNLCDVDDATVREMVKQSAGIPHDARDGRR